LHLITLHLAVNR